jgi:hypothetical protein
LLTETPTSPQDCLRLLRPDGQFQPSRPTWRGGPNPETTYYSVHSGVLENVKSLCLVQALALGQNGCMNDSEIMEWCAFGFGPCWTRADWIALWASFGGVLVAFLLGVVTQICLERRRSKAALVFLERSLRRGIEVISHFGGTWRVFGNEDQIERCFGGLAEIAASVKWASTQPEKFAPEFFVRLLMVGKRLGESADVGPKSFEGPKFVDNASTFLSGIVPAILSDIRFLLEIPE